MKAKTTLIALILILCLVCNAFLLLLSLPFTPNAYTALAFKPTPPPKQLPSNQSTINQVNNYQFVREWGSNGAGDGQFRLPASVAIDSSGNVYVADFGNHRI